MEIKGSITAIKDVTAGNSLTVKAAVIKTFTTITEAEFASGTSATLCYITEAAAWFQYAESSTETVNHTTVLSTADGGQTRWLLTTAHSADNYTNATPSAITVGGIAAGTTFSDVTFAEMFDALLYPTLYPTLTAPSTTFTCSISGYREIGEVIASISFASAFNRGSINPAYGTSGYRSGLPNAYVFTGTDLPASYSSTSLTDTQIITSYTVIAGAQSWTGAVAYSIGEQPLDSKGGNYSTPLAAGTTSAITRTFTGVYPTFATTSSITVATKQALTANSAVLSVTLVAESGSDKQFVDFPESWASIATLEQYNTLSGQWDSISLTAFTTSATTHTIQGNSINYTRYTHNGPTVGARTLRWTT